jgi:Poly(ADP-ribose) polymerase and DNA-Ligase Zn-finger region
MANVIEEAKSGRASCRTCKKAIAKGELRLGVEQMTQFSDTPSMQWHHLLCAATKLPAELKESMATYDGDIPDRAEIDKAMGDAIKKGGAKPGGFPHVDRAPTGRAKCMQCEEAIGKDSWRVAVEREVDTGSFQTRSAGYLHPKCVAENLENVGGDMGEFVEGVKKNSRIPEDDLAKVLAEIGGDGGGEDGDADGE